VDGDPVPGGQHHVIVGLHMQRGRRALRLFVTIIMNALLSCAG
jgi:hypothetical protein